MRTHVLQVALCILVYQKLYLMHILLHPISFESKNLFVPMFSVALVDADSSVPKDSLSILPYTCALHTDSVVYSTQCTIERHLPLF